MPLEEARLSVHDEITRQWSWTSVLLILQSATTNNHLAAPHNIFQHANRLKDLRSHFADDVSEPGV